MDEHLPEEIISRDKYIEILAWSRADAEKANELWVEKDNNPGWRNRNPIHLWEVIQTIKQCRELYSEGDKRAALHALYLSLSNNLPIMEWLKKAFVSAYCEINHYKAKHWDDVFGKPNPKSTNIKAKRKKRELSLAIHDRVSEIKRENPETPIDVVLFEKIGKEFNICKTLASEFYYYVDMQITQLIPKAKERRSSKKSAKK